MADIEEKQNTGATGQPASDTATGSEQAAEAQQAGASQAAQASEASATRQAGSFSGQMPRGPFDEVQRQLDRMVRFFDETFPSLGIGRTDPWMRVGRNQMMETPMAAQPAVNVTEGRESYRVSADLPGMEEKDIDLSVSNGMLCIKGERREEEARSADDWHIRERRLGRFSRSFRLPDDVDVGAIAATFRNGVLEVTLPKRPESRPREQRIDIRKD